MILRASIDRRPCFRGPFSGLPSPLRYTYLWKQIAIQPRTLFILMLGAVAFMFSTAGGVLFAKVLNLFLPERMKFARLWGHSRFEGQQVHKTEPLRDRDVVEIHE